MFNFGPQTNVGGVPGLTQEMVDQNIANPDYDPREEDDLRADDEDDEGGLESDSDEFIWGPTFGFGVDMAKLTGLGVSIDYAYRTAKYFDGVSWLTLTVAF